MKRWKADHPPDLNSLHKSSCNLGPSAYLPRRIFSVRLPLIASKPMMDLDVMATENKHIGMMKYRAILEAIPCSVLVVEDDMRVVYVNGAASRMAGKSLEIAYGNRAGEVLECRYSTDLGCGRSEHCRECVVRNSALQSFAGKSVVRQKVRMEIVRENEIVPIHLLVTTSHFEYIDQDLAVVILEDITELMEIRELVPICAWCKKIRDDEDYWKSVESYLEKHFEVSTTHGICPECAQKMLAGLTTQSSSE